MKISWQIIELKVASATLLSVGILWYPLLDSVGLKTHQLLIFLSAIVGIISGNLFIYLKTKIRSDLFFVCLIVWYIFTVLWTIIAPGDWSPIKVTSFLTQIIMGNYILALILRNKGFLYLRKLMNLSLLVFFLPMIFLSGFPPISVLQIFADGILQANPKVIIFGFFAKAPIFTSFDADGLDGLRHTISLYLVFIAGLNLIRINGKNNVFTFFVITLVIIILQSRSAWLSLVPFLIAFIVDLYFLSKRNGLFGIFGRLVFVPSIITFSMFVFIPLIINRLSGTGSYEEREYRIEEALVLVDKLSISPITDRIYGSSHMFIFDTYYASGIIGLASALFLCCVLLIRSLPSSRLSLDLKNAKFLFGIPFLVRLFTAGSGLPGIGSTLCYALLAEASATKKGIDK